MGSAATQTIIIANGDLNQPTATRQRIDRWLAEHPDTLIIAAAGGAHNAQLLGLTPAVIVGDMDSLSDEARQQLTAAGCHFEISPTRKDQTDLELALQYAVEQQATRISILGALGGSLDQTLANVLLLTLPLLNEVEARIVEGQQTAWLVRDQSTIHGKSGDTLSLIPLGGDAHGITTAGLEYPLDDATLPSGPSLGISNALTGPQASVTVRDGMLLAILTFHET